MPHPKPVSAEYWIIGVANYFKPPVIAAVTYDAEGYTLRRMTFEREDQAVTWAMDQGIARERITEDWEASETLARDVERVAI